jgi:hypothetical protein
MASDLTDGPRELTLSGHFPFFLIPEPADI